MKQWVLFFSILLFTVSVHAQESVSLIDAVNRKFARIDDYKADILMKFDLPGIKIEKLKGKVFFKKPDKFRIKAKGIFFLPKDNPMKNIQAMLADTKSYTSVITAYQPVGGKNCAVVNIIPYKTDGELIVAKLWISHTDSVIYKSEITTRNNGTVKTRNYYSSGSRYPLPEKIIIQVEMKKFKVPKMLAADIKKKSTEVETDNRRVGNITMELSGYKVNTRFSDETFEK